MIDISGINISGISDISDISDINATVDIGMYR